MTPIPYTLRDMSIIEVKHLAKEHSLGAVTGIRYMIRHSLARLTGKQTWEREKFGTTQTSKGKLYQVKDRQLKHEKKLDNLLEAGLLKGKDLEKRVKWFET